MSALPSRDQIEAFISYATSGALSDDEVYTIELLIDGARMSYDPGYWDDWQERDDARETLAYKPTFDPAHLLPTFTDLYPRAWLSLQRIRDKKRPLRSLAPLRFFPNLEQLILQNNEVSDLTALAGSRKLRRLSLVQNPVAKLDPLATCPSLQELELCGTPVSDFGPLARIPCLRSLALSENHAAPLGRVPILPSLEKLSFNRESADTFDGFPAMPKLKVVERVGLSTLAGLERYPNLLNLEQVKTEAPGMSLEPLHTLRNLTHLDFCLWESDIRDLSPLAALDQLRRVTLATADPRLDLAPLRGLSLLHHVRISCERAELKGLKKLTKRLTSWDTEFGCKPRFAPCPELEIVEQQVFDHYDGLNSYGVTEKDTNQGMLDSEHAWMERRCTEFLSTDFSESTDFAFHCRSTAARSFTLVLHSDAATAALPRIVTGLQNILATARNDWIVYLQSDDQPEERTYVSWLYPTKVQTTSKYAWALRRLLNARQNVASVLFARLRHRLRRLSSRR
jgi:hypothetical protein